MSDLFETKNISPMLLNEVKEPFDDDDYIYELKLDGIRCVAYIEPKSVTLQNKRFKDLTDIYPELSDISKCVKKRVILDGELVVLTDGKPDFYALQKRSLMGDKFRISLAAKKNPVQFVAYDIIYFDGKDLTDLPLLKRKEILEKNVKEGFNLSISRYISTQGKAFFELAKKENLEGIVARKKDGLYLIKPPSVVGGIADEVIAYNSVYSQTSGRSSSYTRLLRRYKGGTENAVHGLSRSIEKQQKIIAEFAKKEHGQKTVVSINIKMQ